MADDTAFIAIVSPNAAFSAFVESVLTSWPDIRVQSFADSHALADSLIRPSVVACNFEFGSSFYDALAPVLRDFRRHGPVASLAIVRRLDGWTKARCRDIGIDEVVVKPISPLHLGLRLAALTTGQGQSPLRRSAEILPFPMRGRARQTTGRSPLSL